MISRLIYPDSLPESIHPPDDKNLLPCEITFSSPLRLWCKPEWSLDRKDYQCRIGFLSERILLSCSSGTIHKVDVQAWNAMITPILAESNAHGRKPVLTLDYSGLQSADTMARQQFVDVLLSKQEQISGVVFLGLSPLMRLFVRLGLKIHSPQFPVQVVETPQEAIDIAIGWLEGEISRQAACADRPPGLSPRPQPCPVTRKPIWSRPEWYLDRGAYKSRLHWMEGDILMARTTGTICRADTEAWCRLTLDILAEIHSRGGKPTLLVDFTGMEGAETASRRLYAKFLLDNQDKLRGIIFFGLKPLVRLLVRLGRKIVGFSIPIEMRDNYRQSIVLAQSWHATGSPSVLDMHSSRSRPFFRAPAWSVRGWARELDETFADIPWDSEESALNPLPQTHPFHDVVDGWIAVKRDLDLVDNQRRERERRYRQIVETSLEGIWTVDLQGCTTWCNERMVALLGADPIKDGRSLLELLGENDKDRAEQLQRLLDGESLVREVRIQRKDAADSWAIVSISSIREANGITSGLFAMCTDITGRRQAEDEIRRLNADLEGRVEKRTADLEAVNKQLGEALHSREDFLAFLSHEVRTPLSSILAGAELLGESRSSLDPRMERLLRTIESGGHHILDLVSDVLDLSKTMVGRLELKTESVDLVRLGSDTIEIMRPVAVGRGIFLEFDPGQTSTVVKGDPRRLRQILLNLISNAIKFTPEGRRVGMTVETDKCGGLARATVWDEGRGISKADQAELFQPFVQLSDSPGGTGLGLSLVRELAELHGGQVLVESDEGKGSRFQLILPWEGNSGDKPFLEDQDSSTGFLPEQTGMRLLLAEDNEDLRALLAEYLAGHGLRVVTVADGQEALKLLEAETFDLAILDLQMPVLDGWQTVQAIRDSARCGALPVIALTGGDDSSESLLAIGFDACIAKPVRLADLLSLSRRLLRHRGPIL